MHSPLPVFLLLLSQASCAQQPGEPARSPLPDCEWCGAMDAPANPPAAIVLAPEDEPGETLRIYGTVWEPGGETQAEGVLLYVYHTNIEGIYPKRGDETGNGRRHGYIRGWMRTGPGGRYAFRTIRPGSYPSATEPAHIHVTVTPPGGDEYWIASYLFEDDPLLDEPRDADEGHTGHILRMNRAPEGAWTARRDIVLRP